MKHHSSLSCSDDIYTILINSTMPFSSRVDFGPTVRRRTGDIMRQIEVGEKVLLLYQKSLPQIWLENIRQSIEKEGYQIVSYCLPDGEEAKSLEQLITCWERMVHHAFARNDCVVAVGGGAVSDLSGFCAATYMRGIKLVLVPTTLLSQVDASIGGKTGINMPMGKNLLGSFYFPDSVVVDPQFLTTVPDRQFLSGMGEIVKYAFIEETIAASTDYTPGPRSLAQALRENFASGVSVDNEFLAPLISICIRMKLAVVLADPFESRLRRCLNFGHTIGHGLEKVSNYSISHGESVAIGSIFAFKLAVHRGLISAEELKKAEELMSLMQLPSRIPPEIDRDRLIQAVFYDKKRSPKGIKFVLPEVHAGLVNLDTHVKVDELALFIKEAD